MARRWRMISQIIFFLLFIYLLTRTQYTGEETIALPVKVLLEIDPLAFLATLFATGSVPGLMWLALITIALSLIFGRAFCGWVCPMGTLIQWAERLPFRGKSTIRETNRRHPSQVIKYYLLTALLVAALFGVQWAGIFDPLTIAIRSMGLVVMPTLEMGLRPIFEAAYQHDPLGISRFTEPLFEALQGGLMSFNQPHFHQAPFIGLIFFGILALSFIRYRFWCRILCPLGALLGIFARFGIFRIHQGEGCTSCAKCILKCQGGADPDVRGAWRPSECLVCGNCTAHCEPRGLRMGFERPRLKLPEIKIDRFGRPKVKDAEAERAFGGTQLRRRHFLLTGAAGVAAVPLMRLGESGVRPNPDLIRPPGARSEREFLELCIRCGECMKVCLTNGLQPTLLQAGLEGLWSPRLVPRIGYCEYGCTLCGQVCPTGAIKRLEPEEKKQVKIGLATFDTTRCLPFAFQTTCIVCEEHCPTSPKAIWFEEVAVLTHTGERRRVKQPRVEIEKCTGCGICETKCPIQDRPGIRVTSANEDRNPENRVLLPQEVSGYPG